MSALFSVRVSKVSKESAEFSVVSIHPDSGSPQPTPTFALMLLYDVISNSGYSAFARWDHIESSPLAQEMDMQRFLDEGWIRRNARAFIARVKRKKGGVLEVHPTHPAWISHLRKGMQFETASYSAGEGDPAEARAPSVPSEGGVAHSRNPSDGFRVGTTRAEDFRTLGEVFMPMEGASSYVADPVITDPAKMREAAKAFIGQPAIALPKRGPAELGVVTDASETWVQLYHEDPGGGGWGSGSISFDDIKSFGRAWLKERSVPTLVEPPEKPKSKAKAKKRVAAKKSANAGAKKKR